MSSSAAEPLLGLLLLFALPGFGIYRALFPERRIVRPWSPAVLVETIAASVVLSVALTILVGWLWLGSSTGLSAGWGDPLLELTLAAIAAIALAAAAIRGGFARTPPSIAGPAVADDPEGAMELVRELERLALEERRLAHRLRAVARTGEDRSALAAELDRVRAEAAAVRERREASYAV